MKNKYTIYILIALVSIIVLSVLFLAYSPGEEETKEKAKTQKTERKRNDWKRKFGRRNLHPYGTFIFYQLLKSHSKNLRTLKQNSQYKSLDTVVNNKRLYVFVGKKFDTHEKRMDKILAFVSRGNDAFVSADFYPARIKRLIDEYYTIHRSFGKSIPVNFNDSSLAISTRFNINFIYKRKNITRRWTSFERVGNYYSDTPSAETTSPFIQVLEHNVETGNPVFIRIPYGNGHLYLHTLPYSFTNVVLKSEIALMHAERVIACLPDVPIVIDEYINDHVGDNGGGDAPKIRSSPLQFILENRSLRWAYYTLMIALLLYIVFMSKRLQKIVPARQEIENTSVEFADTMSKLYLQYGQHKYIVFQQEKNLLSYIRNKYYIKTTKVDEEYIQRVAIKSGTDAERLKKLFVRFNKIKTGNYASSTDVVEIYAEIEHFYKHSK